MVRCDEGLSTTDAYPRPMQLHPEKREGECTTLARVLSSAADLTSREADYLFPAQSAVTV